MRPVPGRPARARSREGTLPAAFAAACLLAAAAATSPALAGKTIGPSECTSCHDHATHTKAWEAHTHSRSLDVFEGKKAKEFLTRLGLKDPYSDFCTGCHATVVDGSADYGVSCESCHGGASEFLKPHQKKDSYEQAIGLGMLRTKDLNVRAKNCVGCHLIRDKRILDVGHPTGANFEIVKGSQAILHWKETSPPDQIAAAWKAAVQAAGGAVTAQAAQAQAAPAPVKPAPAQPTPIPPAGMAGGAQGTPAAARPLSQGLPPDQEWPADLSGLDSAAALQARLILVLNRILAESGASPAAGATLDPPSPSATSPEARLLDLQRRVLAYQRRLLASSGK